MTYSLHINCMTRFIFKTKKNTLKSKKFSAACHSPVHVKTVPASIWRQHTPPTEGKIRLVVGLKKLSKETSYKLDPSLQS